MALGSSHEVIDALQAPPSVMPDDRLDLLVQLLPEDARRRLAAGPLPDPHCRLCRVSKTIARRLRKAAPEMGMPTGLVEFSVASLAIADRALEVLCRYHAQQGTRTPACYHRCVRIYQSAGWDGA